MSSCTLALELPSVEPRPKSKKAKAQPGDKDRASASCAFADGSTYWSAEQDSKALNSEHVSVLSAGHFSAQSPPLLLPSFGGTGA